MSMRKCTRRDLIAATIAVALAMPPSAWPGVICINGEFGFRVIGSRTGFESGIAGVSVRLDCYGPSDGSGCTWCLQYVVYRRSPAGGWILFNAGQRGTVAAGCGQFAAVTWQTTFSGSLPAGTYLVTADLWRKACDDPGKLHITSGTQQFTV